MIENLNLIDGFLDGKSIDLPAFLLRRVKQIQRVISLKVKSPSNGDCLLIQPHIYRNVQLAPVPAPGV